MSGHGLTPRDWLISESVRLHEEHAGRLDDDRALAAGRAAPGGFQQRLAARARALPVASALKADIERLNALSRRVVLVLMMLALLAGFAAARVAIADREVDVLLAVATLLALPTLMLLVWVVLIIAGRRQGGSGSLGGGVMSLAMRRLGPMLFQSPLASDLSLAGAGMVRTPRGRWLISAITHGFWLLYSAVALVTLVVFFSVVQYDLIWGTTLLTDQTVVGLVSMLAWLPTQLGLMSAVGDGWILAAREGTTLPEARAIWARFLLAMVVVYGLLPRLLLMVLSLVWCRYHSSRMSLDVSQPGYLRWSAALRPVEKPKPVAGRAVPTPRKRPLRKLGRGGETVIIGIELERRHDQGAPGLPGIEAAILGAADNRNQRKAIEQAVGSRKPLPGAIIAVCSMLRTPDAGTESFLNRLADAADCALLIVVDEGSEFDSRGGHAGNRLADWQALGERVGGQVVMLDSSRPDAAAIAQVHRFLAGEVLS